MATVRLDDLQNLQRALQAEKMTKHRRRVSFGDLITDRWQNAKELGFEDGVSCYDNVLVLGDVRVGRNTWIGPNVVLDGSGGGLVIGENCSIGAGAHIYTHSSVRWATSGGNDAYEQAPTQIGNHCFIGPNAIVAKGVIIGDRVVVGPASFVYESVPSDYSAIGNPARIAPRAMDAMSHKPVPKTEIIVGSDADIVAVIRDEIGKLAKCSPDSVELSGPILLEGIDSLAALVLRETLESRLSIHLPDDQWAGFASVAELASYISRTSHQTNRAPPAPAVGSDGLFRHTLEIGMPLTGINNLAEGPLLQHLGDLRWRHMSAISGVPSKQIVDEDGERLYPTFFFVDLAFPESRPMACYGENERLDVVSSLRSFGASMLDGISFLLPAGEHPARMFSSVEEAIAAGVPAVRLSNVFVKQFSGAQWLKRGRPINPGFEKIQQLDVPPDSFELLKTAQNMGSIFRPGDGFIKLTDGPVRLEYQLVPDRDLNGAGLVYFANYPVFLDICERAVLVATKVPLTHDLLDRRTIVRRRSAYLNNAFSHDMLSIETEAWLENPFLTRHSSPQDAPIRLYLNGRISRKSDGRLMMVSTAEKVIMGHTMKDVPFSEFAQFQSRTVPPTPNG